MRFEHEGIMFWFGTSDAPAPTGMMAPGSEPTVTVGVRPIDGGNRVEVCFRTRTGRTGTVTAHWVWSDYDHKVQYFRAHLPNPRPDEQVHFRAVCRCAGRQAPAPGTERFFAGSFRVGEHEHKGEHDGS